jgi:RNA recognition motif-containing protein
MQTDITKFFVGGLPSEVKQKEIKEYFSKFGELSKVTLLIKERASKSIGYCFLKFDRMYDGKLNSGSCGLQFMGRNIEVHPMVRRSKIKKLLEAKQSRKVFINNIPKQVQENDLKTILEEFGKIENCFIVRSEMPQRGHQHGSQTFSLNYGYTSFYSSSDATTACEARQVLLASGHVIELFRFDPKNLHGEYNRSKRMLNLEKEKSPQIITHEANAGIQKSIGNHFITPTAKAYDRQITARHIDHSDSNIRVRISKKLPQAGYQ